jgi:hypothetical protein
MKTAYLLVIPALLLGGCETKHAVIAHTGTLLGIDLSENPSTGLYHVKLGYGRSEFVFLPSNRADGTNDLPFGGGAKDVAPVIMELLMQNIFNGGKVYQRLAIGEAAVNQPGASLMFAKDADGTLSIQAAAALGASLQTIPAPDAKATAAKLPLAAAYLQSDNKAAFDSAAKSKGYASFATFLSQTLPLAEVQAMGETLNQFIPSKP